MFGLLVKVVGSYTIDPGSIPGSLKLRQKSVVGQELEIFNPILKFTYLTASSSCCGILEKAMQWYIIMKILCSRLLMYPVFV